MKLVFAVIRPDNMDDVVSALNRGGFGVTYLPAQGGFLRKDNTALMIGVEDEKLEDVIGLIKAECGEAHEVSVDLPSQSDANSETYMSVPTTVSVGGATIFVVDVVKYEKF